ncbi:MAG: GNAT family N-acetyltransferase [Opitutaceae bacterium]|jgi:putative acetyltransferase
MAELPPKIRIMRISDYGRVHALWKRTEGIGLNESDTREAIGRFLRRNPNLSLVATAGRRIVGTVLCGHDGRRGYLHHLAVVPSRRRRGLGRELVAVCLDKLRSEGIPKCNLFLFASNTSGKAFWRRIGWNVRSDLRLVQKNTASSCGSSRTSC